MSYYDDDYNDKHSFTFRFDSNDRERALEMSTNELYLGDIFARFKEFLQGCGYEINGDIEVVEYNSDEDYDAGYQIPYPPREKSSKGYELDRPPTHEPKFDFSNIPNNNWPFGIKSEPLPALTTVDLSSITVTDLSTMTTHAYGDWSGVNKYPTMSPITSEQIASWKMEAPGTLGGAKVKF